MSIIGWSNHLAQLEAESIHIMREVAAQFSKPVMLYSIGKDSSVMLHLAMKAFWPSKPPFPLLHIDTTWKFKEMIAFRDRRAAELGFDLIVHTNEEGLRAGIGPFTHGSRVYTDVMKTEALKQALDKYGFDAAFGGARRDEEKSRAKERVFSFRTAAHRWDPRNQRPELWRLYNGRIHKGESIRVFPLSNWTELDVWQYIEAENIPVVPLYFAKERPVVERDGCLIMVDDERMPLAAGRAVENAMVRFRTLGCYPLTGAVESRAADGGRRHPRNACRNHERAAQPRHRSRSGRVDGAQEAGGIFLMHDVVQVDGSAQPRTREVLPQPGELLRFLTCGSVDDGKSTLIGRLLFDCRLLYEDQLAALGADTSRFGTTASGELDFALLVDGLEAEREQGITIDVAYRYFSTGRRSFIVADAPGHEQYTRNMATAASTADLAVLLVDARKGLLTQTLRHSYIVSLMGIRHVVLAVNKMDAVGWDRARFRRYRGCVSQACRATSTSRM